MKYLFVHQNFPGQYRHLAAHYARQSEVVALGEKANVLRQPRLPRVKVFGYEVQEQPSDPFEAPVIKAIRRGKRVAAGALQLKRQGFEPDIIFANFGGERIARRRWRGGLRPSHQAAPAVRNVA